MNRRLELISSLIPQNSIGFADIGTDHGYLPVYMAQSAYKGNIFASDIREKPLSRAVSSAREAGVEARISFILCDGLDGCPPEEIDTIVIAGMGGDTICSILDRAEWCMSPRYLLLLQPMKKPEILRYWLTNNEFGICGEYIVEDAGFRYQLIAARFGESTPLTDAELFTGKYSLAVNNALFQAQLDSLVLRFEKAVGGMDNAKRAVGWRGVNSEILRELYKMKEGGYDDNCKRDI